MPANNNNDANDRHEATDPDTDSPRWAMECEECGNYGETEDSSLALYLIGYHNGTHHDGETVARRYPLDGPGVSR